MGHVCFNCGVSETSGKYEIKFSSGTLTKYYCKSCLIERLQSEANGAKDQLKDVESQIDSRRNSS